MTDTEWRECGVPARMKQAIRGRPHAIPRWVRFNLACIDRVADLLDSHCQRGIERLRRWTVNPVGPAHTGGIGDATGRLLRARNDQLRDAKIAAVRAFAGLVDYTLQASELVCVAVARRNGPPGLEEAIRAERGIHADLLRCLFRSTLDPIAFDAVWCTPMVVLLARAVDGSRDHSAMPILADALQEAGCEQEAILQHCRHDRHHAQGCWVVDSILRKGES